MKLAPAHTVRNLYGVPPGNQSSGDLFDGLDFVSEGFNGINQDGRGTVRPRHVRSFPDGLWQMIVENGRCRVYLGVHWVLDAFAVKANNSFDLTKNVGGVSPGLTTAEGIFASGMVKSSVPPRP